VDNHFTVSFYIPGTLAANHVLEWMVPFDCQLEHVSVGNSAATNGTLMLGISTDTDAYMLAKDIGDSDVPAEYDRDDFVNSQYPHIPDNAIIVATIDYDGASGTAAANVVIVLTFSKG
jgi:hypothetical protein